MKPSKPQETPMTTKPVVESKSETKHTPKTWKVVRGSEADDWGISWQDTPEPFMDIAQMVDEDHAHLIAAAPELAEAVKDLRESVLMHTHTIKCGACTLLLAK